MTTPQPFEFPAGSLSGATVLRFSGIERVSAPFRFDVDVELGGGTSGEDLKRLLGGRAALTIAGTEGAARIRGIGGRGPCENDHRKHRGFPPRLKSEDRITPR